MSMTPACVLLGFLAALMLISKSSASPVAQDRDLQEAIHKRIFCNFYGCGQKRSGGTEFLPQDDAQSDGLAVDSNLASEVEQPFNKNYLLGNLERVPQALESLAAQNGNHMTSPEGEKYLRAAALWESLKNRLSIPSHRIKKRNI